MSDLRRPDGCSLVFETHGDPAHPPILLLEGMGGDLPGWSRTIPHLASELFVIAFDHRGNGWSDAPDEPQSMQTFVEDALALLDHLSVDRAHIYGQSFGGMIALELALADPERVRTLILAATHAGGSSVRRQRIATTKGEASQAIFSADYVLADPEGVRALSAHGVAQQPHAARRQWEGMQGYDVAQRLAGIALPCLVLHGSADRVIDVENGEFLADMIPGAELCILKGAGHVYHWEQSEVADEAILSFIRRHP